MFDKLGDLLNDVLETGSIPESKKASPEADDAFFAEESPKEARTLTKAQKKAFDFFGISEDATSVQARNAYRAKLKYFHPDRHGDNPVLQKVARDKTRQTLEMWEIISSVFES